MSQRLQLLTPTKCPKKYVSSPTIPPSALQMPIRVPRMFVIYEPITQSVGAYDPVQMRLARTYWSSWHVYSHLGHTIVFLCLKEMWCVATSISHTRTGSMRATLFTKRSCLSTISLQSQVSLATSILKPGSLYSMPNPLLMKVSAVQTFVGIALTNDELVSNSIQVQTTGTNFCYFTPSKSITNTRVLPDRRCPPPAGP